MAFKLGISKFSMDSNENTLTEVVIVFAKITRKNAMELISSSGYVNIIKQESINLIWKK